MSDVTLFDTKPAPAVERLARIEGQSNFDSLLNGIEAGPDTTQDMAALAFSRRPTCSPEVLEAHYAQSGIYKLPLMSMVFWAVVNLYKPKERDYPWVQGAISDAFLLVRYGYCKTRDQRAKRFSVDKDAYMAMRNLSHGVFTRIIADSEKAWLCSRFSRRDSTGSRYAASEKDREFQTPQMLAKMGHYRSGIREIGPDDDPADALENNYAGKAPGMADRLGYGPRHSEAWPVIDIDPKL